MELNNLKSKEIMPGFYGKIVHGDNMTWVLWNIDKDSKLPEHYHKQEQIMYLVKGKFKLTLNGKTSIHGPGSIVVIPSNVPHSGTSLTPCEILDVFSPVREEFK